MKNLLVKYEDFKNFSGLIEKVLKKFWGKSEEILMKFCKLGICNKFIEKLGKYFM